MRDLELGPRDQRHFDALEEQAQHAAAQIVAAFRGGIRPAHCLKQTERGARLMIPRQ